MFKHCKELCSQCPLMNNKKMGYIDAMTKAYGFKSVTRLSWNGKMIYRNGDTFRYVRPKHNNETSTYFPTPEDLHAKDWIECDNEGNIL